MVKSKTKLIDSSESIVKIIRKRGVKFSELYLNEALNDKNLKIFYIALGNVIRASEGGIEGFAKKTGLGKRTLYRLGNEKGTHTQKIINKIIKALGFKFTIIKIKKKKPYKKMKKSKASR